MNNKKRFIAGAVCPRCELQDKITMVTKEGIQFRECVECGFSDQIHIQVTPSELDTRVNHAEADKSEESPVRLIDLDKS